VTEESKSCVEFFVLYQQMNKPLPDPGGLLDQTAIIMDILQVCLSEVRRLEDWQRAESDKKSSRERELEKSRIKQPVEEPPIRRVR